MRPNMALITSDFSSLPDVTISGARAPIVASKVFSYISSCIGNDGIVQNSMSNMVYMQFILSLCLTILLIL